MNDLHSETANAPESLSARIYSELQLKLIVGDLKPAESLSIRKLADTYGVSAMPVREALRQLASENALIGAAKKAYRVPDLLPSEAAELFFVRAVLEGAAAEIAAETAQEADFARLDALTKEMDIAWAKHDASWFLQVNFQFHSHIYNLAKNDALASMIEAVYVRTGPWLAHGIMNLVNLDRWLDDHGDIVMALRNRDAKASRHLMEEDARWGMTLYQNLG